MSIDLQLPKLTDLRPRLTVIGIGGAGCNAINNMIAAGLTGVDFVAANTDAQALAASSAEHRIQLGTNLTEGLGAGARPEIGQAAAEEAIDEIRAQITGSHMVFLAAGMGGGTGTGAASVIARISRELGILTVGVVTKPFQFEGSRRARMAETGIAELRENVDTLIVIPNQNLFRIANEKTTFAEAFLLADQVLYSGVACIVDLIVKEGLINLDFADVRAVMSGMGAAMMGTGEAEGESRAITAAEEAIHNPLLDDVSLQGAKGLLLSISGGPNLTLYEVDEAATRVRKEVDPDANIIVGATFDESLGDRVRVSIVASGMVNRVGQSGEGDYGDQYSDQYQMPPPVPDRSGGVFGSGAFNPPPLPEQGQKDFERELAAAMQQTLSAPASSGGQRGERGAWTAPGNVVIEEGLPPFPGGAPKQGQPDGGHQNSAAQGQFTPQRPREIRRGPRMPQVEDFPIVGQREYRAKRGGAGDEEARSPAAARMSSLFGRLTNLGWRQGDSFSDDAQASEESFQDAGDRDDLVAGSELPSVSGQSRSDTRRRS
ncbi:cell division protein FtsZ [Filomicrobium sp.]|uniref:cell division protein FtsZ n=1 Tax=Filomicrobium sp. TaxID=2024831 RepID=UPI0025829AE9|nr:cell division protein FtsZ [Filomicrobium sp.]MCV0369037.1 cell division protein FtsZ [Filomicrobium sp.]